MRVGFASRMWLAAAVASAAALKAGCVAATVPPQPERAGLAQQVAITDVVERFELGRIRAAHASSGFRGSAEPVLILAFDEKEPDSYGRTMLGVAVCTIQPFRVLAHWSHGQSLTPPPGLAVVRDTTSGLIRRICVLSAYRRRVLVNDVEGESDEPRSLDSIPSASAIAEYDMHDDAITDLVVVKSTREQTKLLIVSGSDLSIRREFPVSGVSDSPSVCADVDWNSDGVLDCLIGLPQRPSGARPGRCVVICGATGSTIAEFRGRNDDEVWAPEDMGASIANLGDIDGDGRPDFVAASSGEGLRTNPDFARVVNGATGATLHVLYSESIFLDDEFTCGGGVDFDGDGESEIIFGRTTGPSEPNGVWVISGRTYGTLYQLPWRMVARFPSFGTVPDVDGDGVPELLVVSPADPPGAGGVSVYSGKNGQLVSAINGS